MHRLHTGSSLTSLYICHRSKFCVYGGALSWLIRNLVLLINKLCAKIPCPWNCFDDSQLDKEADKSIQFISLMGLMLLLQSLAAWL